MNTEAKRTIINFFEQFPLQYTNKGEVLIRPEEPLASVFYIVSGSVIKYDISPSGNKVIVNEFKVGAFFPMAIAINESANYYSFEASSDAVLKVAPVPRVITFIKNEPKVLYDLLSRVYRGTDGLQRRMAHLMGGDATSRLLFELINTCRRFGEAIPEGIEIPLSENDLAKRSGLSRETISRIMKKLKAKNLVQVRHGSIVVLDLKSLESSLGNQL